MTSAPLERLLLTTKDGDWGSEVASDGLLPYRVIRGADFPAVRLGEISAIPTRFLSQESVGRRTLRPNDIIIETAGGNRDRPTGRTLLVTERLLKSLDLPATCASFSRFLRVNPAIADPRYIFWYLQGLYERGEMWEHQVQHTGVARFQYTKFAATTIIPLPARSEQDAIAQILGALDDKIELNRRMNETLEAMARAIFKSWFVDFDPVRAKAEGRQPFGMDAATAALFPDSFHDSPLGKIPKGWSVDKLDDLVEIIGGGTPKTSVSEFWDGDIPWYSVVDAPTASDAFVVHTKKRISKAGLDNCSATLLPEKTTIISARGTVGKLALVGVPMAMNQSCYALRAIDGKSDFFTYFLIRDKTSDLSQSTHGTVFDTITRDTFKVIDAVAPQESVTLAFESLVQPLMDRVLLNVKESRTLAAIRDALLPKLISGEIRVRDVNHVLEAQGH